MNLNPLAAMEQPITMLPTVLQCSSEQLDEDGLYLLENGQEVYIHMGRGVRGSSKPSIICSVVFKPCFGAVGVGMPGTYSEVAHA